MIASAAIPLDDPQFWIVTATVLAVAGLAARRLVRSLRQESETPCANCPKAHPAVARSQPSSPTQPRRLPIVALLAALAPAALEAAAVERQVAVMGTTLRVEVEAAERGAALAAAETIVREIEATERRLSTWRDDSELAGLNRAPVGAWIELSPATFAALRRAWSCVELGGGAFDPTVAPLVRAWGLRTGGRVPSVEERRQALAEVGGSRLELDAGRSRARKLAPVTIEEGAFGKGAALDAALDAIAATPAAGRLRATQVDLGGQVAWANAARPVRIDLSDPRRRTRAVLELSLDAARASLSTSGNSERNGSAAGTPIGHLLDPRTGEPAADFGSVSVVAATALDADCLSTALFVMGPEAGARWLAGSGRAIEAVYLVVEGERLRARVTPGLAASVRPLVEGIEVEVLGSSS